MTKKPKPVSTLSDLTPDPQNARAHNPRNIGQVQDSLQKYGAARSIVIDENGQIIAGHGVVEAAALAGIERVQVVDGDGETIIAVRRTGLTKAQKQALGVADNRGAELATWNPDVLAELAGEIDLSQFWTGDELADILGKQGNDAADPGADVDRAAELQERWGTEVGQLWAVGRHRLLVGDCTVRENVERLMGGERAQLVFTDPPYNALKSWKKDEAHGETRLDPTKWFDNDNMEWPEFEQFLTRAFAHFEAHSIYVCCDYRIYPLVVQRIEGAGYDVKHCIVWKKNIWGLGKRYRFQHEFVVYACKGDAPFFGGRDQSDVWDIDVDRNTDHNTPKPVALPEKAIQNSSQHGQIVFDGFCGSGTTLVACERLGRLGRGIELSPAYAAVTLERLATMGLDAHKVD
jgi:DNA modification methylase